MEDEGVVVAVRVHPGQVFGHAVGGVEAQALEHAGGDFAAFLRAVGVDRVVVGEAGGDAVEEFQLAVYGASAFVACRVEILGPRRREHRLPVARDQIVRVGGQQSVQECRAAARQAEDEDRFLDGGGR